MPPFFSFAHPLSSGTQVKARDIRTMWTLLIGRLPQNNSSHIHIQLEKKKKDDVSRYVLYVPWLVIATDAFFFRRAKSFLLCQLNGWVWIDGWGGVIGLCRSYRRGNRVQGVCASDMPSQLHSYLNWPLSHHTGSENTHIYLSLQHAERPLLHLSNSSMRSSEATRIPPKTLALFTTTTLKSFTVIKKKSPLAIFYEMISPSQAIMVFPL